MDESRLKLQPQIDCYFQFCLGFFRQFQFFKIQSGSSVTSRIKFFRISSIKTVNFSNFFQMRHSHSFPRKCGFLQKNHPSEPGDFSAVTKLHPQKVTKNCPSRSFSHWLRTWLVTAGRSPDTTTATAIPWGNWPNFLMYILYIGMKHLPSSINFGIISHKRRKFIYNEAI